MIDPSVREDGEPEPAVELEASRPSAENAGESPLESPVRTSLPRGGRAREALLERAQSMRSAETASVDGSGLGDLDEIGTERAPEVEAPSGAASKPRAPSAPPLTGTPGRLSPNLLAVFGTLLGIATVASLVALGMNLDMKQARESAPAPSTKPSAAVAPVAVEPEIVPKRARNKQPGPWRINDARADARTRVIEGKIGSDPFLKALEKAGVETAQDLPHPHLDEGRARLRSLQGERRLRGVGRAR
ncbi:MAG: hypothetical protein QM756_29550 [Polyangiaceae bacterium]